MWKISSYLEINNTEIPHSQKETTREITIYFNGIKNVNTTNKIYMMQLKLWLERNNFKSYARRGKKL